MSNQTERIDNYLNNLQNDVVKSDFHVEMTTDVRKNGSWYEIEKVLLESVQLSDGTELFIVQEEILTEIIKESAMTEKIYDILIEPIYDTGDCEIVAIYGTLEQAEKHISENYNKIDDIKEKVKTLLYDKKWGVFLDGEVYYTFEDKEKALDKANEIKQDNIYDKIEVVFGWFEESGSPFDYEEYEQIVSIYP